MIKIELGNTKKALLFLTLSLVLTSCEKTADCKYPNDHVHLYVKYFDDKGIDGNQLKIEKYLMSENLKVNGYSRKEDLIEINKDDKSYYSLTSNMFEIEKNWPYEYDRMKRNEGNTLEFYYYHEEIEIGWDWKFHLNVYEDWTSDPYYEYNTGEFRIGQFLHRGFKIVKKYNKKGKVKLTVEASDLVADIRKVKDEYPYSTEDYVVINGNSVHGIEKVYKYYRLPKEELSRSLINNPEYNTFEQPDLSNKSLKLNKVSRTNNSTNNQNPSTLAKQNYRLTTSDKKALQFRKSIGHNYYN